MKSNVFGFIQDGLTYAQRKVTRFEDGCGLVVDTCAVSDADYPYETGIKHPEYNCGRWVIVANYNTREEAEHGHRKWVELMTHEPLLDVLKDVGACFFAEVANSLNGEEFPRTVTINDKERLQ